MPDFKLFARSAAIGLALAAPATGLSADRPARSEPFSIGFSQVPDDLRPWAQAVARRAPTWAAAIERRLPAGSPIGKVTVQLDETDGFVAFATGRSIVVSAAYLRKTPGDVGVVGHELVHMFQDYPAGSEGWVVEGLADYLRYYVLEPGSARGGFDPADADYRGGYQAAAWLLRHVEAQHGCAVIARLHAAMRNGSYDDGFWRRQTGLGLDALWSRARAAAARSPGLLKRASRCRD